MLASVPQKPLIDLLTVGHTDAVLDLGDVTFLKCTARLAFFRLYIVPSCIITSGNIQIGVMLRGIGSSNIVGIESKFIPLRDNGI